MTEKELAEMIVEGKYSMVELAELSVGDNNHLANMLADAAYEAIYTEEEILATAQELLK